MTKNFFIIIFCIGLFIFLPVVLVSEQDTCTRESSRTEEVSLSYTETYRHENTVPEKVISGIISGDISTNIIVSLKNTDTISGDFLVVATFTPIFNIDMLYIEKLTPLMIKNFLTIDYKLLRVEKISNTVFIPSKSTHDVTIKFNHPLYQVSSYEIIAPKKSVIIISQIDYPCQKSVRITYLQKIIKEISKTVIA